MRTSTLGVEAHTKYLDTILQIVTEARVMCDKENRKLIINKQYTFGMFIQNRTESKDTGD